MRRTRKAPTAEEVAESAGCNVETAKQALEAVMFIDDTAEEAG